MLADEDPMYVLYLTPRQFKDFKATTSAKQWQEMYAAAKNRTASISKNPILLVTATSGKAFSSRR